MKRINILLATATAVAFTAQPVSANTLSAREKAFQSFIGAEPVAKATHVRTAALSTARPTSRPMSKKEMDETKGKLFPAMVIGGVVGAGVYHFTTPAPQRTAAGYVTAGLVGAIPIGGGTATALRAAQNAKGAVPLVYGKVGQITANVRYDVANHAFPVIGKQPHLQLNLHNRATGWHGHARLPY